jgi:hypothetical protein
VLLGRVDLCLAELELDEVRGWLGQGLDLESTATARAPGEPVSPARHADDPEASSSADRKRGNACTILVVAETGSNWLPE